MCHPSDGEAWKHFDRMHPEFSQDPRNVRLGLIVYCVIVGCVNLK